MIRIYYIFSMLLLSQVLMAQQDFVAFLKSIENNNKTISSGSKFAESEIVEAHIGIYPSNPEISFDYLYGASENYSELVVSQSFDFPSSYIHKIKIANISEEQAALNLRQIKMEVMLEASRLYAQKLFANRKLGQYYKLESLLVALSTQAERKFQLGEINKLELNRTRSEAGMMKVEVNQLELENRMIDLKISELNGDQEYPLNDTVFAFFPIAHHPDSIVLLLENNHPCYEVWRNEQQISDRNVQLQKSLTLPKLELGYRQDITDLESFRGVHAGLSIPLFENKNSIRSAKLRTQYIREKHSSEKLILENQIRQMLAELESYQNSLAELEKTIETLHTPELLARAYQSGQISYIEFFPEYSSYSATLMVAEDLREKLVSLQLQLYVLINY